MSRLFKKIAANELALGVMIKGGPHLVSTLAKSGFDFVRPDMMFSGIDWREMELIIRTAQANGITPWVRVAANPWFGGTENLQATVDAARAYSLGAEVVQVSVASAQQVKSLLSIAKDWHRSAAGHYPGTPEELKAQTERIAREAMFIPSVECRSALEDMEAIVSLEGLKAVYIACTDLAEQIGHPFGYEHPEVWAAFDKVVKLAHSRGITIVANTGYLWKSNEEIAGRIKRLYDHGARIVMIQGIEFLMQNFCIELLGTVQQQFR